MLKEMLLAGLGGFVGTCARYLCGRVASVYAIAAWPVATFCVNILGCFIIGLILGYARRIGILSPTHSLLLVTGFCGGFTTFSAFANDVYVLFEKSQIVTAVTYCIASVLLGIAAVLLGRNLAS